MSDTTPPSTRVRAVRLAIRLEPALLARVDAYAESIAAAVPGMKASRSDAVRALLIRGLEAKE